MNILRTLLAAAFCIALVCAGCTAQQQAAAKADLVIVENDLHAAATDFRGWVSLLKANKTTVAAVLASVQTKSPQVQAILSGAVTALNNRDLDTADKIAADVQTVTTSVVPPTAPGAPVTVTTK